MTEETKEIDERLNQDIPWLVEEFDGTIFDNEEQHNKSIQRLIDYAENIGLLDSSGITLDDMWCVDSVQSLKMVCFCVAIRLAIIATHAQMDEDSKDRLFCALDMCLLNAKAAVRLLDFMNTGQWTVKE